MKLNLIIITKSLQTRNLLCSQFETVIVPEHYQAETEDSHYPQYSGGGAAPELRKEGVGEDEEDKMEDRETELPTSPEVVLE